MSNPSIFRAWLRRRRQERGLTQEDLSELVGYAAQTITKIEGGQRRPSPQLALRLAEALQLAPDERAAWMAAARAGAEDEAAPPEPAAEAAPGRPTTRPVELPAFLTPFVGREREQAELAALLGRPDCRLVTVLGPGGVGKTRLAIEAARAAPDFADGVAFVSLAPVAGPASIAPAIGDALGLGFSGNHDLLAQVLGHLRERRALLILDNLEHLLDPAGVTDGLIQQVLAQTQQVTVLATSRERLRVAGEWVLELAGLPVPQPHAPIQPDAPALRLFAEHAERVHRAFRIAPENAATIATVCQLVDGLPLGIELAAAWLRLLSLDEIAQELARGLDAAHLSPRTLPARHHSLRAVVEHSWQLLRADERGALRRLSVFRGGFTRAAAQQVAGADLHVLANLVDKSLLRRGASGRYELHEMIRQYADALLREDADELAATRGRHATYFLRLVAEREQRLRSAQQTAAMGEIGAEIDNVRAAWSWAAAHGPLDELDRAAEVLHWFYAHRRWFEEGVALFSQAVEHARSAGAGGDAQRQMLGRLLGHCGYLAVRLGAFAPANNALAESYALLADGRDPVGLARTLVYQGLAARWVGNYREARRALEQAMALAGAAGDRSVQAGATTYASIVAHALGDYEEAERLFRAALALHRTLGEPQGLIWCMTHCNATLLALGKYQEAEELLRESLALSHAIDDRHDQAVSLHNLGRAALQQQNVEEAIYFFREAIPLLRTAGSWTYAEAFNDLGAALWQAGAAGEAGRVYHEGLAAALEIGANAEALRAMSGLAAHLARRGDHAAALRLAARVLADGAARDEARRSAAELREASRAHLAADEAARIEEQASAQPLAALLAGIARPS